MKVLVALSGGIDSAVAAALLAEAGHEVSAVTLLLGEPAAADAGGRGGDATEGARRVAARLGIPHRVLDCRAAFHREVLAPFLAAYREGRTPNPCVECNRRVRFPSLLKEAGRLGCDLVATGHYARLHREEGRVRLLRGADRGKDQSYFLFALQQGQLARLAFPLGEMSKEQVRRQAGALGLGPAGRPESQDLCFAGRGGYRAFLRACLPGAGQPGPIVDTAGRRLGRHAGIEAFTVGQRRGLGVAVGEARYVTEIDPATATVVVGPAAALAAEGCRLEDVSWVAGEPPAGEGLAVQVRYRSPAVPATLEQAGGGGWVVRFARPQAAVAPGQAAVLYRRDEVLGGGTISAALRSGGSRDRPLSIGP